MVLRNLLCKIFYFFLCPGCGDFSLSSVSSLPDPCPLPDKLKKRSLNEKEKLIYAPMTGVGGIVYDKVKISIYMYVIVVGVDV